MVNKLKQWLSNTYVTIEFNKVDIDTVDYEGGYVATTTTPEGTKITVYEREDWLCSDPVFAYSWEKNRNGVITSGSCRASYYALKDYKFKLVSTPSFEEWYKELSTKQAKAIASDKAKRPKDGVSYEGVARVVKEGKV